MAKRPAAKPKVQEATALLRADHAEVQKLFDQFEKTRSDSKKGDLASEICKQLTVHAQIEEEIFYPAAREALKASDADMLDEAEVEHASAKQLIAEIESMKPGEDKFDAKVTVLGEYIRHHVKEEQNEMFPKIKKTSLDLKAVGAQLATRKAELVAELE